MKQYKKDVTALLIIDLQNFYWGGAQPVSENVLPNTTKILDFCRSQQIPIIHITHIEGANISESHNIKEDVYPQPNEIVIAKKTPGAFYQTELDEVLKKMNIKNLIVTGLQTHICCDTTCREAKAKGYQTTIINDATGTFDIIGIDKKKIPRETLHYITLSILESTSFAQCQSTEDFLNSDFI